MDFDKDTMKSIDKIQNKLKHQFNKTRLTEEIPFHLSVEEYKYLDEALTYAIQTIYYSGETR